MRKTTIAAGISAGILATTGAAYALDRDPHPTTWADYTTEVIAHRGAWHGTGLTQNTPEAVRKAADLGADAVEVDVLSTKDRKLVVLHDGDLAVHTTDCTGDVEDTDYDDVRDCTLKGTGGKIPNIHTILREVRDNNLKVYLHDKTDGSRKVGWRYRYAVSKYGLARTDRYVLFRNSTRVLDQYVDQGVSSVGLIRRASSDPKWYKHKYPYLLPYGDAVTTDTVREAQKRGKRVVPISWDRDGTGRIDDFYRMGVDGVVVDLLGYAVDNRPEGQ